LLVVLCFFCAYIGFMWQEILFILFALVVAFLPSIRLVYGVLWPEKDMGLHGLGFYSFFQFKKYGAFSLLVACEMFKPLVVYSIAVILFKDTIWALHVAFLVVLFQSIKVVKVGHKIRMSFSKNLTPLFAYYILLAPFGALLMFLFMLGYALLFRRVFSTLISTALIAPVLLVLTVSYDLTYYWGLILPCISLLAYKQELLTIYPFKERKNI